MRILFALVFVCLSAELVSAQNPPTSLAGEVWDLYNGDTGKDMKVDWIPKNVSEDGNSADYTIETAAGVVVSSGKMERVTPGVWEVTIDNRNSVTIWEWTGTGYRKTNGTVHQRELRPQP